MAVGMFYKLLNLRAATPLPSSGGAGVYTPAYDLNAPSGLPLGDVYKE